MGKLVYPYVIEDDDGTYVKIFKTEELQKEQFVRDVLDNLENLYPGYQEECKEQIDQLKLMQHDQAPLEQRYSLAQDIYSEASDRPYFTLEGAQRIIKRLPPTS